MNCFLSIVVKPITLFRCFQTLSFIHKFRCSVISLLGTFFIGQLFVISAFAQIDNLPEELINYADFVFTNGQVLTADADKDFTIAEAVAVRGNRILAVGSDEKIIRYAGPNTRRIDIQGRSMTPGIIYRHTQPEPLSASSSARIG